MKKLLLGFALLPLTAIAQNFHFSARFGLSGYEGDLKEHTVSLSQSKLFGSLGVRYDISEHLLARSYFSYTKLAGDDKKGNASMQRRNLNFTTKLWDWELTGQYNLFSLNNRWWTPYAFAGVGIFHFNPYTEDAAGERVYLQPLSTEGQGIIPTVSPYKKTQFCLPLGVGIDYSLDEDHRMGIEFGYRKLFTDYLDDVSRNYIDETTLRAARGDVAADLAYRGDEVGAGPYPAARTIRGNQDRPDGYYYVTLTFTIRYFFDKYKQVAGIPGGSRDKRVGCPATRGR